MKLRKIFLLLLLTLLFLGLSYATEVSNDTTNTVDTGIADSNDEVVTSSNMPIKEVDNTITDENNNKKEITKQYNDTVKTESSKTYTVNDFNTLHNALTSSTYNTVTLNINSYIKLMGNTELNSAIKKLTINGNGKTIDGDNKFQFLKINYGPMVTLNNIKITNCYAEDGGAIHNYYDETITIINSSLNNNEVDDEKTKANYGTLIINNSILNNNKASWGGAINNAYGTLTIINSTLNHNKASWGGGAIYNIDVKLTIDNSSLNHNTAEYGGAIYNYDGTLTITNSTLNNNNATTGGAILNYDDYIGTLTINKSILNNNHAESGGAIENFGGTLTIDNSTLNNNTAEYGGAINHLDGTITLTDTILNNNIAVNNGGAIHNNFGTLTITNSTLNNNTADEGGAIDNNEGTLIITNSILNNNKAYTKGGSIENHAQYGVLTITNTTLNNNKAVRGGAIYNSGTVTVTDTLLDNNKATYGGAIYNIRTINVINSTLNDNYASSKGSTIYNYDGTATLTDTILNNTIGKEVGIYNRKGTIAIYRSPTWIKLAYIGTVNYGSTVKVVARLFRDETTALKYKWVNVTVNGKVYKVRSDGAGYIRLNYTVNSYDDQMISVKYGGNSIYPPSLIMTTFNVKQPTWIKVAKMSDVTYGSTVKVVGRLLYNGTTALKYKTVYVTVNDDVYYCKSDGAGYIRLEYTIDNYETQKIIFEYDGSSLYMASRNSTSFKVKTEEKQYTYIKLNNIPEVAYGDTVTISGYYYYGNNIPLTYTPMTLNINGEIFTVKTDAKGFFTYNYKTDRVWKNTLNVSYHGNTRFMAASATATFNVKITSPIETYITLNNIREVKCGEYTTISGYYYYSKDIPLTSTSMTININGQKYYAKTDNTGYFVLSYKTSKVGKNTVTVSYQGNSNFKAATKSATFQVKS